MTYLDRPPKPSGPPWAHNSFGASLHAALAAWWRLAPVERTINAAGELLEQLWSPLGFRDAAHATQWRARARSLVQAYVARLDPRVEPVGVERTFAAKTATLALSGRVDRLDDRDGDLVIVDYKAGRQPPIMHDVRGSIALALYAIAVSRTLRRPCHAVELHHLPTGSVVAYEHTDESLDRQLRRAEDIAAEAAEAAAFPPRPGAQCGWCSWRAHCPEGQAAAPAREPWDGLGDLADCLPG
jgi:RecB family exonuclease